MLRLMFFELKKMLSRRVALATNIGVIALLAIIMAMNVVQTKATDAQDRVLSGTEAIAFTRDRALRRAGELTPERVRDDLAGYRDRLFSKLDPDAVPSMTGAAVFDLVHEAFGEQEAFELYDPYWSYLLQPWAMRGEEPMQTAARVTPEVAADYYGAVAGLTRRALDEGQGGSWEFSPAERAYWTRMQERVPEPLAWGYAGGWQNIIDCAAFLVFAIIAACVTVTPVFTAEYQSGTDAVILSSRWGRSRLVAAKILASMLYATAVFAVCAAIICGVSLAAFGADGAGLPVQLLALASPYPISAGQAAAVSVVLMYLACIGFTGLTLLLSSRSRSTLAVLVPDIALLLMTGLVPTLGIGVLTHAFNLFPLGFSNLNTQFVALFSYPFGGLVIDLPLMVALVYAALTVVALPCAASSFARHQVQ